MRSNYINVGKAERIFDKSRSNLSAITFALLIGDDSISDLDGSTSWWPLETAGANDLTPRSKHCGESVYPGVG